jgi:hypothetical protein
MFLVTETRWGMFLGGCAPGPRHVSVLPHETFSERLRSGYYVSVPALLTEGNFPVTTEQVGGWRWKLLRFREKVTSQVVIGIIQMCGFRPGQIGHLLALESTYPEQFRRFKVIALGSVALIRSNRMVPALANYNDQMALDLCYFDGKWSDHCVFLAVQPLVAASM